VKTKNKWLISLLLIVLLAFGFGTVSAQTDDPAKPMGVDGDGFADLAIGVPGDEPGGVHNAGGVNIGYGSNSGLIPIGTEHWHQDVPGTEDSAEMDDLFGRALAVGDFNGDKYYDLAVGVPQQSVNGYSSAGAVHVFYGSNQGLSTINDKVWDQNSGAFLTGAETGDWFGAALAAGDFDGDGFDDLAIGAPNEDWGAQNSGVVNVLYGTASGLATGGQDTWRQGNLGLPETEEIGDGFGSTLATGDFNRDGRDDLAIGVKGEDFEDPAPTRYSVGVVHVLYGSDTGLSGLNDDLWYQDLSGLIGTSDQNDAFGSALAAGDFDGDGFDELAIGLTGQEVDGIDFAGAVHILPGNTEGLITHGDYVITQNDLGFGGKDSDHFGSSLAVGDFNGDHYMDLAVGAPDKDFLDLSPANCGSVNIIFGSWLGLSTSDPQVLYQGLVGVADEPEENDQFGESLAAGDFNADGYTDLVIGVPYEDKDYQSTTLVDAGVVHILNGSATGISGDGDLRYSQDNIFVLDEPGDNERFGFALAVFPRREPEVVFLPLVIR